MTLGRGFSEILSIEGNGITMKIKSKRLELFKLKEFLLVNIGLLSVAVGICFFKAPNHFVTGGVSGIAIILNHFFKDISLGPIMLVVNTILLLVGFFAVSFEFGTKTLYASFALSGMVWGLEKLFPLHGSITGDMMIELVFGILFPAIGSAIIFNQDASTGGTDIIAKLLCKHIHVHVGTTLLATDFVIAASSFLVFGPRVGMYSVLGLTMKAFIIDLFIENMNIFKQVEIICNQPENVKTYITEELGRGATIHSASGAYSNEEKTVIKTVISRQQAIRLRKYVRCVDQGAFITVTNTSEIIGKGFRNIDL